LGYLAGTDASTPSLNNATAIGAYADVTVPNAIVLGGIAGTNGCTTQKKLRQRQRRHRHNVPHDYLTSSGRRHVHNNSRKRFDREEPRRYKVRPNRHRQHRRHRGHQRHLSMRLHATTGLLLP